MKLSFKRKCFLFIGILVLLSVGWGLLVYAMDWPISEHSDINCSICRAGKETTSLFMVPVSVRYRDNEFSRYYNRYCDVHHTHTWTCGSRLTTYREGEVIGDGGLRIPYEMAWAILQSLPKGQAQKEVFEKLSKDDPYSPEGRQVLEAIIQLREAYFKDRDRKDWPELLRKYGLYPKSALK